MDTIITLRFNQMSDFIQMVAEEQATYINP